MVWAVPTSEGVSFTNIPPDTPLELVLSLPLFPFRKSLEQSDYSENPYPPNIFPAWYLRYLRFMYRCLVNPNVKPSADIEARDDS